MLHAISSLSESFKVIHKSVVEVMEEGTEAAGATGVGARFMSFRPSYKFDHPFFYFIVHRRKKTPVFMGRLSRPA